MRGKWAAGIPPRNFTWVIQDQLAMSERPGGFAPHHRRVRRQEEIIWLRVQGFTRIVSMLPSSHNLQAYEKGEVASAHFPVPPSGDARDTLSELYQQLEEWLGKDERLLIHQEELGDSVVGVVAGFLLWSGRLPAGPQAIAVAERLSGRQLGPAGRELVSQAADLRRSGERNGAPRASDDLASGYEATGHEATGHEPTGNEPTGNGTAGHETAGSNKPSPGKAGKD